MALARLNGGPLDGQVIPLDDIDDASLVVPYGVGQIVYRRQGDPENTGANDGPTQVQFSYVEESEVINPTDD